MLADGDGLYNIDVIYKDEWQYYTMNNKHKIIVRQEPEDLFFDECPVIVYNTNDMSNRSVFHKVIRYINALDFLITGNANDMEKLADALLVLTKVLKDEDLRHLIELKAIMDISKDERAEYLEKNTDPAFREYASKLLIQEIHKHSHVIDWYSPDNGLSGDISGKALKIRLFDMDMFSRKVEKVFKKGVEKVKVVG
jgi:SPP1 family phage portal protein